MNIALLASSGVLAPLHGLWRWFTSTSIQPTQAHSRTHPCINGFAIHSITSNTDCARVERQASLKLVARRPLRIVRIQEAGQAPSLVGRMVISGRMADVCAELDRLAAREAAMH